MKRSVAAIMFHGSKPDLSLLSGHHAGLPWIPGQRCNQIGNSQHDWPTLVQMRVNLLNHDKCSSETDSNIIKPVQRAQYSANEETAYVPHISSKTFIPFLPESQSPLKGFIRLNTPLSPTQVAVCLSDVLRSPAPGLSMSESRPVRHLCPALPWP